MQRLDGALGAEVAALTDASEVPALVWKLLTGGRWQIDPGHLEQRDRVVPEIPVVASRAHEALDEGGAQDGVVRGERHGESQRVRVRVARDEAPRVGLGEAAARHDVLDEAAEPLILREAAEHLAPRGQRERDVVEPEACDLLHEVDLARDVAGPPGRDGHSPLVAFTGDLEAEPLENAALLAGVDLEPDDGIRAGGPKARHRPGRELGADVRVTHPVCARRLDEQLGRENGGLPCDVRIDALLPAVRRLAAQAEPLGRAQDADRLEVRRLEQDVRRRLGDLGLEAAHDAGDGHGAKRVRDEEVGGLERPLDAVQGDELLARLSPPDADAPSGQALRVEGVERAAEGDHDVVRDVDDVRDGPYPRADEPRAQPQRRLADRDAAEEPADVARAALEVGDLDLDRLVALARRVASRRRRQRAVEQRRYFPREAVDGEQIGAVAGHLELEHVVAHRHEIDERRPRLGAVIEDDDPRVVGPELELVLGEDHPVGELAAELRPLERAPVGEHGARQRHAHGRAGPEVPGPADDLARLGLADVDAAELELVRVRVLARLDDPADEEAAEVAVLVGDTDPVHPLDLGARDRQPLRELGGRRLERDVLTQPGERNLHRDPIRSELAQEAQVVFPELA